ncbi:hypothetical protein FXF51_09310 [Nonomuraea sp. PA05]|nr:hypothetical protein FXF51_09310 [Nonomuraea sp. PA05]
MAPMTAELAERIVAGWRGDTRPVEGWDSPAGPLFAGGDYAESDITMEAILGSTEAGAQPAAVTVCGTVCTDSRPRVCC